MSGPLRARVAKIEKASMFQEDIINVSAMSAALAAQLHKVLQAGETSEDRNAAAEILKYGPGTTATFAKLSDHALRLAEQLLEAEYERVRVS